MNDYSEITATAARDLDKLKQLLREGKWNTAEIAAEELGKNFIRLAMWCRDKSEEPKITIGRDLMRL